ncbi:MAG: DUF2079 domain-containing protein, partial [Kiritimatiellae bacterium]|nr:DUF2079 domain-containing protein [Kiritimatiellia bacterium]
LLLHMQTAAIALGALGIYFLAKKELSEKWATGISIVYLVYPPLIYMNLYEFHPVAFATCFLIFMIYFYKMENFAGFLTFMTLAILCQENMSLIVIMFAFYAMTDKRRGRWVWMPFIIGICYFVFCTLFLMPRLNNNIIQFRQLYAHLGDSSARIVMNIIFHPLQTLGIITTPEKVTFLNALFGPLGYLSFLNPATLIPAIPVFLQRLLSNRLTETRILFHYQAEFIPFIFVSAIYGIKRLLACKYRLLHLMPAILLPIFSISALLFGGITGKIYLLYPPDAGQTHMNKAKDMALKQIPSDAPVVATFGFLPKLANRPVLYSLHHIYTGKYTLSSTSYPIPKDIRYLVIDTMDQLTFSKNGFHGSDNYKNLQTLLAEGTWEVIEDIDSILVLEKTAHTPNIPPEMITFVTPETTINTNVVQSCKDPVKLCGFSIIGQEDNKVIALTLYWKKENSDTKEYDLKLTLSDDKTLFSGVISPGHRIWPTQSWPVSLDTNKLIADRHFIRLDQHITAPLKLHVNAVLSSVD